MNNTNCKCLNCGNRIEEYSACREINEIAKNVTIRKLLNSSNCKTFFHSDKNACL